MNSEYRVVSAKTIMNARNIEIRWNGWLFDIVYWQRENNWFLAIPNHQISCVICSPTDTVYNLSKIFRELNNVGMAKVISQAIKEDYEEWRKENESKN